MRLIDADDLIKAFEALDLMNGQYAESFSNMAGNRRSKCRQRRRKLLSELWHKDGGGQTMKIAFFKEKW